MACWQRSWQSRLRLLRWAVVERFKERSRILREPWWPAPSVTATNVATGVQTSRKTTDAGFFVLSPLQPGEYTVTVKAEGFQTLTQEHMVVDALGTLGLNPRLQLGTSTPVDYGGGRAASAAYRRCDARFVHGERTLCGASPGHERSPAGIPRSLSPWCPASITPARRLPAPPRPPSTAARRIKTKSISKGCP